MNAVTFIEENIFRTYSFNTISQHGCSPEFAKCLEYAHNKICFMLSNIPI